MPMISFKKVGGIWFWRIGRAGGSLFLSASSRKTSTQTTGHQSTGRYSAAMVEALNRELLLTTRLYEPDPRTNEEIDESINAMLLEKGILSPWQQQKSDCVSRA